VRLKLVRMFRPMWRSILRCEGWLRTLTARKIFMSLCIVFKRTFLTEKGTSVPDIGAGVRNTFVPEEILGSTLFLTLTIELNALLPCDAHKWWRNNENATRKTTSNSNLPCTYQSASPEETACTNESDLDLQETRIGMVMRFWDLKDAI